MRNVLLRFLECVGLKLVFDNHEAATEVQFHALSTMFSVTNGKE
jgi:hypothetical protein